LSKRTLNRIQSPREINVNSGKKSQDNPLNYMKNKMREMKVSTLNENKCDILPKSIPCKFETQFVATTEINLGNLNSANITSDLESENYLIDLINQEYATQEYFQKNFMILNNFIELMNSTKEREKDQKFEYANIVPKIESMIDNLKKNIITKK